MKLDVGQSISIKIHPGREWEDTQVDIGVNEEYKFFAPGKWVDLFKLTDANGFPGNKWYMPHNSEKRAPEFNWFALMGSLDKSETNYFFIGKESQRPFPNTGRLTCFANDKRGWFFLNNNWKSIKLVITRIK